MEIKKIGIIGSGDVGKTLARGFSKHGYDVMIGSRNVSKLADFIKEGKGKIKSGNFNEAGKYGDMVVLAVKGTAAKIVANMVSKEIEGKIVIDVTNPIADSPPENGVIKYFTTLDSSLMEQLQKENPKAKFVKAFNSVGNAFMVNPDFKEKPTMFIGGNDKDAKKEVSKILVLFGFEVEDLGKAEAARAIEPLCILWCIPGFVSNNWNHAFRLLKK